MGFWKTHTRAATEPVFSAFLTFTLLQVVHLAHADPDVLSDPAVGDAVHYLAIIVWGARLLCQLRRRPALPDLQVAATRGRGGRGAWPLDHPSWLMETLLGCGDTVLTARTVRRLGRRCGKRWRR